jgi:hypothetical protein
MIFFVRILDGTANAVVQPTHSARREAPTYQPHRIPGCYHHTEAENASDDGAFAMAVEVCEEAVAAIVNGTLVRVCFATGGIRTLAFLCGLVGLASLGQFDVAFFATVRAKAF